MLYLTMVDRQRTATSGFHTLLLAITCRSRSSTLYYGSVTHHARSRSTGSGIDCRFIETSSSY